MNGIYLPVKVMSIALCNLTLHNRKEFMVKYVFFFVHIMLFCYIIGLSCLSLKTDPNEQSTNTCFENNSLRTEAVKFQKSIQSMHDCHKMTQGKIQRHTQVFIDIYKDQLLKPELKIKIDSREINKQS